MGIVSEWLRELRERVDPEGDVFAFRPGVSASELEGLSAILREKKQIELGDDFLEIYRHSDGEGRRSGGLFFGLRHLSLQELYDLYGDLKDDRSFERPHASSNPPEAIQAAWFNPRWIPFAADAGGSYLALDFDPGPRGERGQVITMGTGEDVQRVVAPCFEALISELLSLVRDGNFRVRDGVLCLKRPPMTHFLDRYHPHLVERAEQNAGAFDLHAELEPTRPLKIDLNEGVFGSPAPDLVAVERVTLSTRDNKLWEAWACEGHKGFSRELPPPTGTDLETHFADRVTALETMGLKRV